MKNMKFIALLAAAMAVGAAKADDSYLYWMVGTSLTDATVKYNDLAGPLAGQTVTYDYAMVKIAGEEGYLNICSAGETPDPDSYIVDKYTPAYAAFPNDKQFTSFLFELYNENDDMVGWATLARTAAGAYIYGDPSTASDTGLFKLTQAIPEPSSGLLLLLGMAGLALRRRRA